jgi:hypothetical protein
MSEDRGEVQGDLEAKRLLRRKKAMEQAGIEEIEATRTAVAMLLRDRPGSGDDRRVCFECANLDGRVCRSDAREAMHVVTRGAFEPVRTILQRCEGFELKGKT